jgi:hypothetical protein
VAIDNVVKDKSGKFDAEPKVKTTQANQIEKRGNS